MKPTPPRRVAVTGMGCITAIGKNLPEFTSNLFQGTCGIKEISLFDVSGYTCRLGGQVSTDQLGAQFKSRELKRISRCDLLGLIAAKEAVADADLDWRSYDKEKVGVIIGGGAGGMLSWEKFRKNLWHKRTRLEPSLVLASAPCTLTDLIANRYGLGGMRATITTACSSSANSIGYAFDLISCGQQDLAVTGGSEALSELTFAGFNALKVMSPEACRPFDKDRRGLSLGEGAGILILEEYEHAQERGAVIYAEIMGYAVNADAYHMTSPDPEGTGMTRVMTLALDRCGIDKDRVDYINAHGTATKINDRTEAQAIQNVFGKRSAVDLSVSSTKSMVGHCLGSAGSIEAIAAVTALYHQNAPPTAHLKTPDPECRLKHVMGGSRKEPIRYALSNSFAFGGNNTALLFKRAHQAPRECFS